MVVTEQRLASPGYKSTSSQQAEEIRKSSYIQQSPELYYDWSILNYVLVSAAILGIRSIFWDGLPISESFPVGKRDAMALLIFRLVRAS